MQNILLTINLGNPWDYLNGTSYKFGIDAGNANTVITAIYLIIRDGALAIATILILASFVSMIWAPNSQERAAAKKGMEHRFVVLFILGASSALLSLLMTLCNKFFGIV